LTGKEYPFGGNSAYRAGVFVEIGGFDSRLGRIGFDLLSCEEVELAGRLRASGKRIYYDPDVKVRHLVLASRACKAYFLARRYADGRSIAVWEGLRGGKWLVARNAFLRLVLTIVRDVPGYVLTAVVRSERHFTYDCRLAKTSGYLKRVVKILTRGIDGGLVS
jgi:GT2 family glycosyltransferase